MRVHFYYVQVTKTASARAQELHGKLNEAIAALEESILEERQRRLEALRKLHAAPTGLSDKTDSTSIAKATGVYLMADDPILQWSSLHQAVNVREIDNEQQR